jgi:hypothetical protein
MFIDTPLIRNYYTHHKVIIHRLIILFYHLFYIILKIPLIYIIRGGADPCDSGENKA